MPNDDGIESRKDNDSLGGVCLSGETSHIQGKVLRGAGGGDAGFNSRPYFMQHWDRGPC